MSRRRFFALPLLLAAALPTFAQERFAGSDALDRTVEEAIAAGQIPGAVLLVGQPGKVLHRKAYGLRALVPAREPMTVDTIFDAASLTKIVATTSSLMKLEEEGKIRVADRVTRYLPNFQGGKSDATVRHLMTHFAGLRPDLDLEPEWSGYQTGIDRALVDKLTTAPGERFVYSDIGFILLGEIVRVASGQPLNVYARENIFLPAGMTESMFLPPASLRPRIAPTERVKGEVLRGVVHDPTARYMGGVAGHAGLFITAADLARWAEMLLNGGEIGGRRILSPLTMRKFTEPNTPPHQAILRGLGFDLDSPYSSNRGELFPIGSFGHTGFTGTSIWIDPSTKTYVVLLANSVHPERRPAITALRGKVATIAAAALGIDVQGITLTSYAETNDAAPRREYGRAVQTQTGLDLLAAEGFARLKGRRVGLITNHTGLTASGQRNIDAMLAAGVRLTGLFSPEHGLAGREDQENISHGRDEASGLPVWSLYQGKDRRPSEAMLRDIDVLVFDIQDVGARFYTYTSTMMYAMEAAAKANIPFMVLDRPNPITGLHPEGPMLDPDQISFVGCFIMPLRHAMTLGELARLINVEEKIHANLDVVAMKNWRRGDWWDATGLAWVDPSPNMRSLNAALLYTGVALIEYARNYSVGRGTDAPFEQVGADWIDGSQLATYLNRRLVPGVRFYATRFRPVSSNFQGTTIGGVRFVITDRESFSPFRAGLEIAAALQKLYPGRIDWDGSRKLIGNQAVIDAIRAGEDPRAIEIRANAAIAPFLEKRARYLLYQ